MTDKEPAVVVGYWRGYDGEFSSERAPEVELDASRDEQEKINDFRSEVERLWSEAHPNEPFPCEIYGYDW